MTQLTRCSFLMDEHSLPVRRIAITMPPANWFYGIARDIANIYRHALVDLGLSVFDVPVEVFLDPDLGRITGLLADLRAFRPELALGLVPGTYALICRLPPGCDGWRPNLFTEVLDIPTVCMWEHGPLDLADQLLTPLPNQPADSWPGAQRSLRRALTHPRLVHWSRDTGHTRIMGELGFASPDAVVHSGTPALPGFGPTSSATGVAARRDADIGFIGHLYQEMPAHPDPALEGLADSAIEEWLRTRRPALWDVLVEQIAALPSSERQRLALEPEQSFFWRFTHQTIVHRAQTSARLKMLGAVGSPVACHGNLVPGSPGTPRNLRAASGRFRFGTELSAALARYPIMIDVLSPGWMSGYGEKPILGFASGGFVLVDRKRDFVNAFGEIGEAVSYGDEDDLAAKVDRYLANPRLRTELGNAMRAEIKARHSLECVLRHVLHAAWYQHRSAPPSPRGWPAGTGQCVTVLSDLRQALRTHPYWPDARVDHKADAAVVTTSPQPWAYSAEIPIPSLSPAVLEPHLCLSLEVETGRIGLSAMRLDSGELLGEQLVSASRHEVSLVVEVPYGIGSTVIIRNTVEGASRVRITKSVLCARSE